MKIAVRYYSRGGNTKLLADTIAKEAIAPAISVDDEKSNIEKNVDLLFIGGALYAYGIDKKLKQYLKNLDNEKIKKAAVFSTSWISKHAIDLIKKELEKKNIEVFEEYIYVRGKIDEEKIKKVKNQTAELIRKCK